jgi:hypothetical protein
MDYTNFLLYVILKGCQEYFNKYSVTRIEDLPPHPTVIHLIKYPFLQLVSLYCIYPALQDITNEHYVGSD